MYENLFNED